MSFLLDIIEVPESHTGAALARAFQAMLKRFHLEHKVGDPHVTLCLSNCDLHQILAFNGDNATSNDTQTAELEKKNNSFTISNHVRCFNHTIQLSAKALLKPFAKCISAVADNDDDMPGLDDIEDDDDDEGVDGDDKDDEDEVTLGVGDDTDDGIDEFEALSEEEKGKVLEETAAVKETISKVSVSLYDISCP